MATIAATIADTVAGMQRVLYQNHDFSDSDEPYLRPTNYANKLKRKSQFNSRGLEGGRVGVKEHRKTIKHAGYSRDIIRRNPKRYDDDGDELTTEDEDEAADARAAEENPYSDIRLEHLLAPLTSASSLPHHPSLSTIYSSSTIGDMARHACAVLQRERRTLASTKRMLTKFRGDDTWVPAGKLSKEYDDEMLDTTRLFDLIVANGPTNETRKRPQDRSNGASAESLTTTTNYDGLRLGPTISGDKVIEKNPAKLMRENRDHQSTSIEPENAKNHQSYGMASDDVQTDLVNTQLALERNHTVSTIDGSNVSTIELDGNSVLPSVENGQAEDLRRPHELEDDRQDGADAGSQSPPRRITRAQAQADKVTASSRSATPQEWVSPTLHPLFLIPESAKPDADLGLPSPEAQETRHLLAMYVQKQEEVCRGAERLYEGLLLADRQCKEVLKWCKAEGHVGEMSDGEDWYDKEEWGLEEDLRKGHAEEEEDTTAQGKKTRGRRA